VSEREREREMRSRGTCTMTPHTQACRTNPSNKCPEGCRGAVGDANQGSQGSPDMVLDAVRSGSHGACIGAPGVPPAYDAASEKAPFGARLLPRLSVRAGRNSCVRRASHVGEGVENKSRSPSSNYNSQNGGRRYGSVAAMLASTVCSASRDAAVRVLGAREMKTNHA
jgi:hypothetical protein